MRTLYVLCATALLVLSKCASGFTISPSPTSLKVRGRSSSSSINSGDNGRTASAVGPLNAIVIDAVNNFFVTSPYAAAAIACGTKASAADFVAQRRHYKKRDGSKDEIDIVDGQEMEMFEAPRNIAFLLYGAVYQGCGQEFIYNHLYPVWFGSGTEIGVVAMKVAFDLLVQTTILTLPVAYLTKAAIFRYSPIEGLRRYWEDITQHNLLVKYFALWGPVQCLTFSIIPEHFRVAFIAVVSFFWLIILSSITAKPRKAQVTDVREGDANEKKGLLVQFDDEDDDEALLLEDEIGECELIDGLTCNVDG